MARAQRTRLRSLTAGPSELIEEAALLGELGEEVSEEALPATLAALVDTGRLDEARALVARRLGSLGPRTAVSAGWTLYRRQAHDLVCDLFGAAMVTQRANVKFLNAFENAARRAGRVPALLELYAAHAAHNPALHGRMRELHG